MISIEERNEEDEMDNINTEVQETVETGTEPAPKKRGRASAKDAAEKADKKTVAKKTTAEKAEKKTADKTVAAEKPEKKTRGRKDAAENTAPVEVSLEEKKPAARRTAAKKAEPVASVTIQYKASEVAAKKVVAAAIDAYKAAHEGAEVTTVEVYIKPEENAAYYVVNGDDSEGNNRIELF